VPRQRRRPRRMLPCPAWQDAAHRSRAVAVIKPLPVDEAVRLAVGEAVRLAVAEASRLSV